MEHSNIKTLYRYGYHAVYLDDNYMLEVNVGIERYNVIKHTPKGFVIDLEYGLTKFVLNYGRKRFAYPTPKEAIESLVIRKRKHIGSLKRTIKELEVVLSKANEIAKQFKPEGNE